ncbi:MAG: hypothetical protein EAX90_04205 [Candidatus Heimdallarchaeota archaeon]|nr:hypothetical protein [Candidatus Heimdallarchaeota archaeon]
MSLQQILSLRLGKRISAIDFSPIVFHKELERISIDEEVQLLCKRELIDKITCPALLKMKDHIQPIDK